LSAGASGAIFGLFGALLYFGVVYPRLFFRSMGFNMLIVLVINLVFGFTVPGIDNAGHIGGLIGGFAAAGIVHFPRKKNLVHQGLFTVFAAFTIVGLLQFGFNHSSLVVEEQSVLILAQDYIQDEEYDQAFQFLNEYVNERDASAEILFLLSFTEIKLNHIENAKSHLHEVIELDSDFHEAQYNLALIYLEQELFPEALHHAGNAVKIEPENTAYNDLIDSIMVYMETIPKQ
jgi:rhomboid protease GluP